MLATDGCEQVRYSILETDGEGQRISKDSLNSERLLEIEKDVRIWFQVIIQCTSIRLKSNQIVRS